MNAKMTIMIGAMMLSSCGESSSFSQSYEITGEGITDGNIILHFKSRQIDHDVCSEVLYDRSPLNIISIPPSGVPSSTAMVHADATGNHKIAIPHNLGEHQSVEIVIDGEPLGAWTRTDAAQPQAENP